MQIQFSFDRCCIYFSVGKHLIGINYRAGLIALMGILFYFQGMSNNFEWYWDILNVWSWCRMVEISWTYYMKSTTLFKEILWAYLTIGISSFYITEWLTGDIMRSVFWFVWGVFVSLWWNAGKI